MSSSGILDFEVLEPTIELYSDLCPDELDAALHGLRNVVTNFRIEPSQDGSGNSVWCDAYARTDAVDTRSMDNIERDNLIIELRALQFDCQCLGIRWEPSRPGRPPIQTEDVRCLIENSDYELGVTFQRGAVIFSFWPQGWRKSRGSSTWEPIEIVRYFRRRNGWSDEQTFSAVRTIARLAYEDQSIQSLLVIVQEVNIPERDADHKDSWIRGVRRSRAPLPSIHTHKRAVIEEPAALELFKNLTVDEAEALVGRLGRAVTNFVDCGDVWGEVSIRGDVIPDLAIWDSRTAEQRLRDMAIVSLQRLGLVAEAPICEFDASNRSVYVELFEPGGIVPLFSVSDRSVGCAGRHPATNKAVWLSYSIDTFPGGAVAAYGFLSLIADARMKGQQIQDLLIHHRPTIMPLHTVMDDDDQWGDATFPSDVFEGGYVGDGLWTTGSGIRDLGR